jgi:MoxR-like ATPase
MDNKLEKITISQLKEIAKKFYNAKQEGIDRSILFLGSPGLGKTEALRQTAEELGIAIHVISPVQHASDDFGGIPVPTEDNQKVKKLPVEDLFPKELMSQDKGIYFIDEITSADFSTQGALYRLLLEGRTDTFSLPKGWLRVAAGNLLSDKALVNELSSALINRVSVFQITPDENELANYFIEKHLGKVTEEAAMIVASFIKTFPEVLREEPSTDSPFTSPRSLERAIEDIYLNIPTSADISKVCSAKLTAYISELSKLPKAEEFLKKPELVVKYKDKIFSIIPIISGYVKKSKLNKEEINQIKKFLTSASLKEVEREFVYMLIKQTFASMVGKGLEWEIINDLIKDVAKVHPFISEIKKLNVK